MVLAISPKEIKTYTAEGYLALEVASETRNEFRNVMNFAMEKLYL